MSDPKDEERAALVELTRRLVALTPRPRATLGIVVVNVAVFGVMVASGVHPLMPTPESLIKWGANFGPKVSAGDWWRLFTAMFVHVGAVHILMNMWALWNVGGLVERALGTTTFLVVYLLSGWAGSIASVLVNPMTVSAGASGAIFGVFGVMLAFVLRPRSTVPRAALKSLRGNIFFFLALNLWLGIKMPAIDLAAHGGGLVCGFVLGALLTHELTTNERRAALRRTVPVGAFAAVALSFLTFILRGTVPDFQGDAEKFDAVEHRVFKAFEDAERKAAAREISDQEYADILDRDVLGPWRGIAMDPKRYRRLPPKVRQWIEGMAAYHAMREHSWESMAHALRSGDTEEYKRGRDEFERADTMAEEMSKRAKEK